MANIFLESFDNIATADLLLKGYTSAGNFVGVTIGAGRTGNGLTLDQNSGGQIFVNKILPSNYSSIVFGCAFKTSSSFPADQIIWSFSDSSTDQINISLTAAGQIKFTNGAGTILGYSPPATYARGSYYYFEFKPVFSLTATGSINYRINGAPQTAITGIQTAVSSNAWCNIIKFWQRGNFYSDPFVYQFDDMYANDTTGAVNNDYMGDVRIFVDRPATATNIGWVANGAGNNILCVSENTPDGDTTYLSSNTTGVIDLYTLTAPPSGLGTVKAVQSNIVARKDDGITRQICPVLGDGVHANVAGTVVSIGNNYVDYLQSFDINPLTGLAWTVGDLSTLRLGVKEVL
jgi:hypothetical protein